MMRTAFVTAFCFLQTLLFSQELPVLNEYHLNKSLINPAITGSEACALFRCTDRHQWVGVEGAPQIQTLSVDYGISNQHWQREFDRRTTGVGFLAYRDKNGAYRTLGIKGTYAYHFYVNGPEALRLGLGASVQYDQITISESGFIGDPDPLVTGATTSSYAPDASVGAFLYHSKFYAGLSAVHLLNFLATVTPRNRNYFFIIGYLTGDAHERTRFQYSTVIKATEDLRRQIDLNGKLNFDERWWLGISYRHNFDKLPGEAVSIIPMMGFNAGNFDFTYALDITPKSIQLYNNYGTHELMISYRFCKDGFRCPAYR
jgi:type IX secretion system PorP/SprF family membrane protein